MALSNEQKQALLSTLNTMIAAKTAFDNADQALTVAVKAYNDARNAAEVHVSDWNARVSR